jgi:hypothetical protein
MFANLFLSVVASGGHQPYAETHGERIATAAPTCRILTTAANLLPLSPFSLAIVFLDSNIDIKAAILVGMVHLSALQGGSASCLASSIRCEAISAKKGATISRVDTLADNVAILTGESHLHFAISLQGSAAAC